MRFCCTTRSKYICFFALSLFTFSLAHAQQTIISGKEKARALLKKNSTASGLDQSLMNGYQVSDAYEDKQAGIFLVYLQQTYQNIPVYNKISVYAFKNDTLVHQRRDVVNIKTNAVARNSSYSISPEQAIRVAANHLSIPVSKQPQILRRDDLNKNFIYKVEGLKADSTSSTLLWLPVKNGTALKLAWNVHIAAPDGQDDWFVRIDAQTGEYLDKNNLVLHEKAKNDCISPVSKSIAPWSTSAVNSSNQSLKRATSAKISNHFFTPSPSVTNATYRVYPFTVESPNFDDRSIVRRPWGFAGVNNNATTYGWHFDGVNNHDSTRGNNVWARDDIAGKQTDALNILPGGNSDISNTGFPILNFDQPLDFSQSPVTLTNLQAGIDNLFYMNNVMHDISYQYGFDEPAGNFQANNLGRGGAENDYVNAFSADAISAETADFFTPSDGRSPMMRMYLWIPQSTPILIDGSLDNGIIAHEYTHGISSRLTGGPTKTNACLTNMEQGGEGWSDYMALMVTTNWATATISDGAKSRTIGTYVNGETADGAGLRRFPYSTDMGINPLTYSDLVLNPGVHEIGEVWCAALWDMTWNIIQQEGIDPNIYQGKRGNNIALQLVMLGMKLQPCSPGFLDSRDAILKADSLLYNYKHRCVIWNAFARRGMGKSALQGDPNSLLDQVPATNLPSGMDVSITADKTSLKLGDHVTYTIATTCQCGALEDITIVDTLPNTLTYVTSAPGGVFRGDILRFNNLVFAPSETKTFTVEVVVSNPGNLSGITNRANVRTGPASLSTDTLFLPFTSAVLALRFVNFDVQKQNTIAALHWKVSDEKNIDKYIVQRSADGIIFSVAGEVAHSNAATGEKDYYFNDNQPLAGNNYYRIAVQDLDGKISLSVAKTIRFDGGAMTIKLQPVPAYNRTVQLTIENADGVSFTVNLLNAAGQAIKTYNAKPGVNQLDLQNFAKGIYYLKVQLNNGTSEVKKLVIE